MGTKSKPRPLQIGKSNANYSNAKLSPNLRTMNTGIRVLKLAGARSWQLTDLTRFRGMQNSLPFMTR